MVVLLTPDLAVWVSSVAQGYCAAFLEKTCYSHGASLHQGVLIGNGELLVRGGGEGKPGQAFQPIVILLVANLMKLR